METQSPYLVGHTNINNAYEVNDYPYGFRLRTSIFYWIETKDGHGDRFCSYTIDPRNGKKNKPKCGTYSPFLFMYINEEGHVKCEGVDSYDREKFKYRFAFILNKIGEMWINETQQKSLRVNHYQHLRMSYPYHVVKYSEEKKPIYTQWMKDTLQHIKTCPFAELVNYPDAPEEDNPTGEVKMIITQSQTV